MSNKKLLIVDDEPDILEIFGIELRNRGFQVQIAKNGKEAISLVSSFSPDLVITDLRMPDISGFELIKNIRKQTEFKQVPLIAISANSSQKSMVELERIGVDGFLRKPINFEHLTAKVDNLLRKTKPSTKKTEILFSGSIEEMSLLEVAQLFHQGRKSGILKIEDNEEILGEMIFNDGNIIYASSPPYFGLSAFHHLIRIEKGEFKLTPNLTFFMKNIWIPSNKLIMKAATEYDEFDIEQINNQLFLPIGKDFWIQGRKFMTELMKETAGIKNIMVFEKSGRVIMTIDNDLSGAIESSSMYLNLSDICMESNIADNRTFFLMATNNRSSLFFELKANFVMNVILEQDTQLGVVLKRIQKKKEKLVALLGN